MTLPRQKTPASVKRNPPERFGGKATIDEIIVSVAPVIANDWYRKAIRQPWSKFYLYWRPAKVGERMSLPIIDVALPNDEYTQDIQISNAWSVTQTTGKVIERMRKLPILLTAASVQKQTDAGIESMQFQPTAKEIRGRRKKKGGDDVVKNPGESVKVWICPNGEALKIPTEHSWRTAMPANLKRHLPGTLADSDGINRMIYRTGNRYGYYRGVLLNERLYIHLDQGLGVKPKPALMAKIRRYAKSNGLTRGIVLERS